MPYTTRSKTNSKKIEINDMEPNNDQIENDPEEEGEKGEEKQEKKLELTTTHKMEIEPPKPKIENVVDVHAFESNELIKLISHMETFDGRSDARKWFHHINTNFMQLKLSLDNRLKAITYLLQGDMFIWFSMNEDKFTSYTQFSKLFAQEYFMANQSTVTTTTLLVPDNVHTDKTPVATRPVTLASSTLTSTIAKALVDKFVKDPVRFAGSKDNVSTWLEEIEQQFNLMQLTDSDRLNLIHICLKHEALYWYRKNNHKFMTWSNFVNEITKAFQSRMKQDENFEKLKRYRQTSHQSVTQYYLDMINLMKQADPDMNESTKVHYLINGLLPSLLIETRRNYPMNSEQFLANAKVAEELTALHHSFVPVPVFGDETTSATSFHPNPNEFNDPYRHVDVNDGYARDNYSSYDTQPRLISQIGKSTSQNSSQRNHSSNPTSNDTSSKIRQLLSNNNPNRNNNYKQQQQQQQQRNQEQTSRHCFKCGSPNHLVRQCNRFQNRSQ